MREYLRGRGGNARAQRQKHKQVFCSKLSLRAKSEAGKENVKKKKKVKDKQQTAEADSVIVWIGDRLLEY